MQEAVLFLYLTIKTLSSVKNFLVINTLAFSVMCIGDISDVK